MTPEDTYIGIRVLTEQRDAALARVAELEKQLRTPCMHSDAIHANFAVADEATARADRAEAEVKRLREALENAADALRQVQVDLSLNSPAPVQRQLDACDKAAQQEERAARAALESEKP